MFCPRCGTDNPDDAKFCGSCGASLPVAPAPQPPPPPPAQPPVVQPQPAVAPGLKIGIIIASLVVPLVGIILGIIYMLDPNPQKKAAGRLWLMVGGGMVVLYCFFVLLAGGNY